MVDIRACDGLVCSGYSERAIWDTGNGASVRSPLSSGEKVWGLSVALCPYPLGQVVREPASRDRTMHTMHVAAPGLSTPGTSAPKTVRGVRLGGLAHAQSPGTVGHQPVDELGREDQDDRGRDPAAGTAQRRNALRRQFL
ncbi:hypothetical protein SMA5143A_1160 [Streptomyces sp. MA5143a]|nr:hypothetical protein SMA5143A_1160 [Streptomyces sp. MA5143a]